MIIFACTYTCICENDEYLGSILNDSIRKCDEIIEPTKNKTKTFEDQIISILYLLFY